MTDIVERLKDISDSDHNRGCQGREYSCSCGYDEENRKTAAEASQEITQLRGEVERLRVELDQAGGLLRQLADMNPNRASNTLKEAVRLADQTHAPTGEPL